MINLTVGDCRNVLPTLPAESVHCVVTSPPYWGLRDYAVSGQIGQEPTPDEYIDNLASVFCEVWRVLRADGILWLNLGDCYNSSPSNMQSGRVKRAGYNRAYDMVRRKKRKVSGLKVKELIGIPWHVAFALQEAGWWLRRDVIWAKGLSFLDVFSGSCTPESVRDRPTTSHEYLFLLTKASRYFYDYDAVRERGSSGPSDIKKMSEQKARIGGKHKVLDDPLSKASAATNIGQKRGVGDPGKRNLRSVWVIQHNGFDGGHFATFPPALVEPCIKAGTSELGCCSGCGAPWERVIERGEPQPRSDNPNPVLPYSAKSGHTHGTGATTLHKIVERTTIGWQPTCDCPDPDPVPCVVLDPFGGAGTVGLVADRLGRDAILIELNPEYAEMARRRLVDDAPMFVDVRVQAG